MCLSEVPSAQGVRLLRLFLPESPYRPKATSHKEAQPSQSALGKRVNVTLLFVAGIMEKVKRLLMKHGISVSTRPSNTFRAKLVHLDKDKIAEDCRSNVVYRVECGYPDHVENLL